MKCSHSISGRRSGFVAEWNSPGPEGDIGHKATGICLVQLLLELVGAGDQYFELMNRVCLKGQGKGKDGDSIR